MWRFLFDDHLFPPSFSLQARTFDDMNTVDTVEDLADGILLNKIMNTV